MWPENGVPLPEPARNGDVPEWIMLFPRRAGARGRRWPTLAAGSGTGSGAYDGERGDAPGGSPPRHRNPGAHGRGDAGSPSRSGSIPARAGETFRSRSHRIPSAVHPRACGGNRTAARVIASPCGPSPRVRGKLGSGTLCASIQGSIPARAGETQGNWHELFRTRVHPRACGGNRVSCYRLCRCRGPSPRVRGKPTWAVADISPSGSIPARAGETPGIGISGDAGTVHPRACGGNCRATGVAGENVDTLAEWRKHALKTD